MDRIDLARTLLAESRRLIAGRASRVAKIAIVDDISASKEGQVRRMIERAARSADEIFILLDSEGGTVRVADAIAADLGAARAAGVRSRIFVPHRCYSAAMRVLRAADRRIAAPGAEFLIHCAHYDLRDVDLGRMTAADHRLLAKRLDDIAASALDGLQIPSGLRARVLTDDGIRFNALCAQHWGVIDQIGDR